LVASKLIKLFVCKNAQKQILNVFTLANSHKGVMV